MKVIYKKTMLDKINDAILKAKSDNKKIDYIELDVDEMNELKCEVTVGTQLAVVRNLYDMCDEHNITILGVRVTCKYNKAFRGYGIKDSKRFEF